MNNTDQKQTTQDFQQWQTFCNMFAGSTRYKELIYTELDSYRFKNCKDEIFPELTNIVVDIIILSGTLKLKVDNREFICTPETNNFVSIGAINIIQNIEISDNFKGHLLAISRLFAIQNFSNNSNTITLEHVMILRLNITYTFEPLVLNNIITIIRKIDRNITRNIFLKRELIIISLAEFYLEKILVQLANLEVNDLEKKKSRKSHLCSRFCALVFENCKQEHEVSFYADKLCITPQYLTRVLQENYSRSAKNIIDNMLISEATVLLYSDKSLQQIADILNFADQSSFGKFFKKITGYSPSSFRELNGRN